MKRLSLIACLLLVACDGEEGTVVIPDFVGRSPVASCLPLPGPEPPPAAVSNLQAHSDTSFVLVDEDEREVSVLDRAGRRITTVRLERDGPRGVALLTDALVLRDSLLVVADGGRSRLRAFDLAAEERWSVDLAFPPQRLALAGERLLIAPMGMDGRLRHLVYTLDGRSATPLDVPLASHPDALARMFLNYVTLQGYPDGSALVAHQFVRPRAWRIGPGSEVTAASVPVPDAVRSSLGFLPPLPFTEEDLARIAAPVLASAPDPLTGGLVYLTRSGRERGGRSEKALVRVTRTMQYGSSLLLDVNAVAIAYLGGDSVIVVDDEQGWFRCDAP